MSIDAAATPTAAEQFMRETRICYCVRTAVGLAVSEALSTATKRHFFAIKALDGNQIMLTCEGHFVRLTYAAYTSDETREDVEAGTAPIANAHTPVAPHDDNDFHLLGNLMEALIDGQAFAYDICVVADTQTPPTNTFRCEVGHHQFVNVTFEVLQPIDPIVFKPVTVTAEKRKREEKLNAARKAAKSLRFTMECSRKAVECAAKLLKAGPDEVMEAKMRSSQEYIASHEPILAQLARDFPLDEESDSDSE